jgi:hypothetical protein
MAAVINVGICALRAFTRVEQVRPAHTRYANDVVTADGALAAGGGGSAQLRLCALDREAWARASAATPPTESTHWYSSNPSSALSSRASRARLGAPMTWLASTTRCTPKARQTRTCATFATVIAHAPRASCSRNSAGAMVVLPCGASSTFRSSQYACIRARLCSSALFFSTMTGSGRSSPGRLSCFSATAENGTPCKTPGIPFASESNTRRPVVVVIAGRAGSAAAARRQRRWPS